MTFLLATRNAHKAQEICAILGPGFRYLSLNDFPNAPDVIEDAGTFAGNASKKAVSLAQWISSLPRSNNLELVNLHVLADDSGLEVDALAGAPGVHSARFAALDSGQAGNSSDSDNRVKLQRLLKDVPGPQRTARFRCVLALTPVLQGSARNASPVCFANESELATRLFEGACEGMITFEPRGTGGFGYDPLFIPQGYDLTFAELGETTKNALSHRARAVQKLQAELQRETIRPR